MKKVSVKLVSACHLPCVVAVVAFERLCNGICGHVVMETESSYKEAVAKVILNILSCSVGLARHTWPNGEKTSLTSSLEICG